MPENIFHEIFNWKEKVSKKNIKELLQELETFKKKLEENNDVDNLKVLHNKIELILKNSTEQKIAKNTITNLKKIIFSIYYKQYSIYY